MDNEASFGAGVESTLSFADAPVAELRERLIRALRYTFSWSSAVGGGGNLLEVASGGPSPIDAAIWQTRIDDVQKALRFVLASMPLSDVFATTEAKGAYEHVSEGFAQLYRDLALSRSTLPRPDLLEQLGDLGKALFDAPAAAITAAAETASNAIARALGGTAAAIWSALWPWLIVAGVAGTVYVFRAPLLRAVSKVSA